MSTSLQRQEDLEWLQVNYPDFITYYPNTRRVQLACFNHFSVDLMRKGLGGPVKKKLDEEEVKRVKKKTKKKPIEIEIDEIKVEEIF